MRSTWTRTIRNQIQGTNERAMCARERERQEADSEFILYSSGLRIGVEDLLLSLRQTTAKVERWSTGDGEKLTLKDKLETLHMLTGIFGVGDSEGPSSPSRPVFTYDLPQSYLPESIFLTRIFNCCSQTRTRRRGADPASDSGRGGTARVPAFLNVGGTAPVPRRFRFRNRQVEWIGRVLRQRVVKFALFEDLDSTSLKERMRLVAVEYEEGRQ
ncbi:hypothetical protein R3P38DRAFT_1679676 [Favolaschia claudopus]|uniref:Uncharacterized protein n=1 Tax=Favolaschia claudopus TaxID=2862362 RepID=A0AAW0ADP0_9AGAR